MPQDAAVIFFFTGLEVFSITDLTAIVHQNDIFKAGLRQFLYESDHPVIWIQGGNNNGYFVIKCPHNLLLLIPARRRRVEKNSASTYFSLSINLSGQKGKKFFRRRTCKYPEVTL